MADWTDKEKVALTVLVYFRRPNREIAAYFGRPVKSVTRQKERMGLRNDPSSKAGKRPWVLLDLLALLVGVQQGMTDRGIGAELGRPAGAVKKKRHRLGLFKDAAAARPPRLRTVGQTGLAVWSSLLSALQGSPADARKADLSEVVWLALEVEILIEGRGG